MELRSLSPVFDGPIGGRVRWLVPDRPPIPEELRRAVLMEAGHRCAIPICHQVPVEIAHIVPWAEVQEHTFDNLIALCPTCHTRYDTKQIDRRSMRLYKANLAVVNGRYGDLERRVLRLFAENPAESTITLFGGLDILLMNLLDDGLLVEGRPMGMVIGGIRHTKNYEITAKGREFIDHWVNAKEL